MRLVRLSIGTPPLPRKLDETTMTRTIRYGLCHLTMAAAILLFNVEPSLGQSAAVPCSAFTRQASGGWKVLAPVMLNIDGRLFGPTVGSVFAAGSTMNGIRLSQVLDHECR